MAWIKNWELWSLNLSLGHLRYEQCYGDPGKPHVSGEGAFSLDPVVPVRGGGGHRHDPGHQHGRRSELEAVRLFQVRGRGINPLLFYPKPGDSKTCP